MVKKSSVKKKKSKKKSPARKEQKTVPLGVRLSSLLYLLLGVSTLILGILIAIGSSLQTEIPELKNLSPNLILFLGIINGLLGIFEVIVSLNLLRAKNWARISAIILSALTIIQQLNEARNQISLLTIILLIIWVLTFSYLLFNQKARDFFLNKTKK
ncbi:DUF2127 domain-containing protein [Candidatus Pacearchaeota archaeon]|nr:MAG: DUF2127 domain-containing protein [Candidatus Pacearchaeota archaeon]